MKIVSVSYQKADGSMSQKTILSAHEHAHEAQKAKVEYEAMLKKGCAVVKIENA